MTWWTRTWCTYMVMVDMDHLKDLSGTFGLVINLGFNPVSPMPGKPFAEADFSKWMLTLAKLQWATVQVCTSTFVPKSLGFIFSGSGGKVGINLGFAAPQLSNHICPALMKWGRGKTVAKSSFHLTAFYTCVLFRMIRKRNLTCGNFNI